jgi:hypothetical protein
MGDIQNYHPATEVLEKYFDFQSFFDNLVWFDLTGYMTIENKIVKIILEHTSRSKQYEGFKVEVIDKVGGLIDKKDFKFKNYIKDYEEINGEVDWGWDERVNTKTVIEAIKRYVDILIS